jgi:hypothetical protein
MVFDFMVCVYMVAFNIFSTCNCPNKADSGTKRHRAFGKKYVFSSFSPVLAWPRQRDGSKLRFCRDFSSLHLSPGEKRTEEVFRRFG